MYADHISQLDQFAYRLKAVIHTDLDSILDGLRPLMPAGDPRLTSAVSQLNECLYEIVDLAQERMARALGARSNGRQKNKSALAARDQARTQLRHRLILLRQWVEGLYGQTGLDLLYIQAKTPERPDMLVTYAQVVIDGLSVAAIKLPKAQIPMILDRELWASELQTLMLSLEAANHQLAEKQAEFRNIQKQRVGECAQLEQITRALSHLLKGLLLLADQPGRIKHLKKVRRKRPQARTAARLTDIHMEMPAEELLPRQETKPDSWDEREWPPAQPTLCVIVAPERAPELNRLEADSETPDLEWDLVPGLAVDDPTDPAELARHGLELPEPGQVEILHSDEGS